MKEKSCFSFIITYLLAKLTDKLAEVREQLDARRKTKSLHGGVRILHIRADADSLDLVVRELVDDDTTLKTGVDGDELGVSAKHGLVDSASGLAETRIGLSGPSGAIGSVLDLMTTIEGRVGDHVVGEGVESLVDR